MKILLIVYDNDSYIHFFPQGIAYLAAVLKKEGHDVEIYQQDVNHWPDNHLTSHLDNHRFDLVGLGFVAGYYQFKRATRISHAVNRSKNRKNFIYVLGGHGPSAEPEFFKEKMGADRVVVGEAEYWAKDPLRLKSAISFFLSKKSTPSLLEYTLILEPDFIPFPAYDLFPIEYYRLIRWPTSTRTDFCMPILTGRGCPYHCTFCYRMDEGFRPRSPETVIEEMEYLNNKWGINHFQFSDELFMSSDSRIWHFCEALLASMPDKSKWAEIKWDCNGRLNFASKENLDLMKAAGCQYINYGCEALDDQVLKNIKKGLTVDQIYSGVEATIKAGITPGLNFMWGNIGDTKETLQKAVDFLLKYDGISELRTIRPVTPYPGCQLYHEAIKMGALAGPEDFYEKKHVNSDWPTVNFMEDVSDGEFAANLMWANQELMRNYYTKRWLAADTHASLFYGGQNPNFRGFREV